MAKMNKTELRAMKNELGLPVNSAVKAELGSAQYRKRVEKPSKGKGSYKRDNRIDF